MSTEVKPTVLKDFDPSAVSPPSPAASPAALGQAEAGVRAESETEERFDLSFADLAALIAMGFQHGYRTGAARLKLQNPREELLSMSYSFAVSLVREKPWEQRKGEEGGEEPQAQPSQIIQVSR